MNWCLEDLFLAVKEFPSSYTLSNTIFIAQETKILKQIYHDFTTITGTSVMPSSIDVGEDIDKLENKRFIYFRYDPDYHFFPGRGKILLNERFDSNECAFSDESKKRIINLAKIEPEKLLSLACILMAKRFFKKEELTKENLYKRLSDYFFNVNKNKMNDYFMQIEGI